MSPTVKKLCFSGIVLALLLAAMLVSLFLQNSKEKRRLTPIFPRFAEHAGGVVLVRGQAGAILSKSEGLWFVATFDNPEIRYPADSVKVISVVNKISEMTRENFVGSNSENFAQYGFEGDSAYFVQIYNLQGVQVGDFILGNRAENWRFNFFREISDTNVYLVGGGIGYAFSADVNEWRIKRIFDFAPEEIVQIKARYTDQNYTLVLDSAAGWIKVGDPTPVNPQSVADMIREFVELNATDWDYTYSIPDVISGLDAPTAQYEITLKSGKTHSLVVGKQDGARPRFFVRYDDNPQVAFVLRSPVLRMRLVPDLNFRL